MDEQRINQELRRIKEEYIRREKEIPKDYYSLKHPANLYMYTQRIYEVINILRKENIFPLSDKFILDVGCGSGLWLLDFLRWGAEQNKLYGIDLIEEMVKKAKQFLPYADLRLGDASSLPFPDNKFDIVLQSLVFTSILDGSLKKAIAKEMLRVLKPTGFILWYDFIYNNPKNPNVRGIKAKEIIYLFPDCRIKLKRITLAPPIVRFLAPRSYLICYLLEKCVFFKHPLSCGD